MNDERIIVAIREHHATAIEQVMDRYSALLWKVVSGILADCASDQDVEECIADTFVHLWMHPDRFDPCKGKLSSWLCMVARSRAIDRYRQVMSKREVVLEDIFEDGQDGPEAQVIQAENRKRITNGLQQLNDTEQEIIIRRFYHNQKPREIALAMDMSVKQVTNHLHYAKQRLKQILGQEES